MSAHTNEYDTNQGAAMNSEFMIDKAIPVPSHHRSGSKYPFQSMEIGDSFLIPIKHRERVIVASKRLKHLGLKIITRKVNEHQVRIWRIA